MLEVLLDFKSVALPLEWLLQVAPRLQPRLFSIASSLRAHPCSAHVTAAVVSWQTPFKRKRKVPFRLLHSPDVFCLVEISLFIVHLWLDLYSLCVALNFSFG